MGDRERSDECVWSVAEGCVESRLLVLASCILLVLLSFHQHKLDLFRSTQVTKIHEGVWVDAVHLLFVVVL